LLRQLARARHQLGAGFNAIHVAHAALAEKTVVQHEAQVTFACAVIGQCDVALALQHLLQQRLDELQQVVHLLELAAAVLVELAVAREDVQRLEQLNRLARRQAQLFSHRRVARCCLPLAGAVSRWGVRG
jgi:hypothetical protein